MARTPSTEDVYEGDGTTTVFQFHFPYLAATDVFVSVDGVNVSFTLLPGSIAQVQTTVPPAAGTVVRVYRSTLAIVPQHLFAGGVPFLPRYVDENNRQLLYASQEAINDTAVTAAEALVVAEEAKEIAQSAEDKVDNAIIDSSYQLRLDMSQPDGPSLLGYRARIGGLWAKLSEAVSPFDYGAVGNFVTDDTAAVMAAFNEAKSRRVPLLLNGDFGVTHLDFAGMNGMNIVCSGTLTGQSSGAYESVVTIRNSADVSIVGRLVVNASYNPNYACGIAMYTDNGSQCSIMDIYGVSVVHAVLGWRIGRRSEPDALISEITFYGGHMDGVPTCYEVIGTQTVLSFIGVNAISGVGAAPTPELVAHWQAQPRCVLRSIGAGVSFTGGESLIVEVASGLMFDMQPISSPQVSIGNRYGNLVIRGTVIECASQLLQFRNPEAIPDLLQGIGYFDIDGSQGYHGRNLFPLIQVADDFTGRILLGSTGIFSNAERTQPTVACGAATCGVWIGAHSFGQYFPTDPMVAVSGGRLHFAQSQVLEVNNLGSQSIPSGVPTILKFTTLPSKAFNTRFGATWNSSTGRITVPLGGWKSVRLVLNINVSTVRPNSEINVIIDGAATGGYSSTGSGKFVQGVYELGDLVAGQTIEVRFVNLDAAFVAGSSANDFMKVFAAG